MAIHSIVLEQQLGELPEGTVIQVAEEIASSLVSSGVAREATEEDISSAGQGDDVAEEVVDSADDVAEEVTAFRRNVEEVAKKNAAEEVAKAVAANTTKRPNLNIRVKDHEPDPTGGFSDLGAFVQCVIAKKRGDYSAIRKMEKHTKSMDNMLRTKTSGPMSIVGSHVGSDLVPQQWSKELWGLAFKNVVDLHGLCTDFPMENQIMNIPVWVQSAPTAGIVANVTAETASITDTAGVTATVQLSLVKYTAGVKVTDELQRFNSYTLKTVLEQRVPQRIRYLSNDNIVNGGNGQINLIGDAATVTLTRTTNNKIEYQDVLNMEAALFDDFDADAVWLANKSTMPYLYTMAFPTRAATTPIPVLTPSGLNNPAEGKPPYNLLGRPIYWVENCPAYGSKGDLILVSFSAIAAGTTGLIADSTPYLLFDVAEEYFRFMWYADTVNQLTTYYTRKDSSKASNIVVLSASS